MRIDLYRGIHKGIRAMLSHLVALASRTSFDDVGEVARLREEAEDVFDLLSSHAHTEDRFVHPLLAGASDVLERLARGHRGQEGELARLSELLHAPTPDHRFVLGLTRFVAEQLVHMADEEEWAMPAIWAAHDDATLEQAQGALLASIPAAKMARYMAWMLPALSARERAGMEHASA